jgi:hypothetical protein
MKSTMLIYVTATILLAAAMVPDRVAAQNQQYNAFALATLGGSAGDGVTMNDLGWALGRSSAFSKNVDLANDPSWCYIDHG